MSIRGTFAKIQAKTCICGHLNQFYGIRHFFYDSGGIFASIGNYVSKIRMKTSVRWLLNWLYNVGCSIFSTFESFCVDRRYLCKNTGENVCSPALKLVLRHLPFFI